MSLSFMLSIDYITNEFVSMTFEAIDEEGRKREPEYLHVRTRSKSRFSFLRNISKSRYHAVSVSSIPLWADCCVVFAQFHGPPSDAYGAVANDLRPSAVLCFYVRRSGSDIGGPG